MIIVKSIIGKLAHLHQQIIKNLSKSANVPSKSNLSPSKIIILLSHGIFKKIKITIFEN